MMKLTTKQVGNKDYPRYAICCENGTWWNGKTWTPHEKEAMLYASLPAIKKDWKELQSKMKKGEGVVELQATIRVTITCKKPLTKEEITRLAWYMSGASGFTLDYSMPKPEGFEEANISTQLMWDDLKEKESEKK